MNAYGSDHNLCFLGYKVVMCSGAEWLRDSTENCSDVKKVVFFKGDMDSGRPLRTFGNTSKYFSQLG